MSNAENKVVVDAEVEVAIGMTAEIGEIDRIGVAVTTTTTATVDSMAMTSVVRKSHEKNTRSRFRLTSVV